MENNTEQSNISSLATIKAMVQRDIDKKEEILRGRGVAVLSAHELDDTRKMTNTYKSAIDRNNEVVDFYMDVKNDILKLRLVKDRLDKTTSLYLQQSQQIDWYIKTLNEILGIVKEEKEKMDRIIRFYERNYNSYTI
jgi:hypothetical protein